MPSYVCGKEVVDSKEWLILSYLHFFLGETTKELEYSSLLALAVLSTRERLHVCTHDL